MNRLLKERFPVRKKSELPSHVQEAINAANRAAEKLKARKKALGQKFVIWKDGEVVIEDA